MKLPHLLFCVSFLSGLSLASAAPKLSVPNASPEAVALYQYLLDNSGKHTLSGQHSVPLTGDTRLATVEKSYGVYPAVFSQDFGFSAPGTWDGINYRQRIVDDSIRRHSEGFIINLMWHAVRPTDDEPQTFEQSVQGKLTDEQWREVLTPGTRLNERWKAHVDVIAFFLRQLRDARVPVLWRPYHEMNGKWFWWGGRPGPENFTKLYRMLYDRLTNFHGLNNLIWVYGPNEVKNGVAEYADFFPGHDVVDALATDVYTENFNQYNYDTLLALADGKPIALGETGPIPTVELLKSQPRWSWFVAWYDLGGVPGRDRGAIRTTFGSEAVVNWQELPWVTLKGKPVVHYPVIR